ncbi:MAG: lipid A deacylase LpxR family protein [Candidatus Aminicenantes bacterium]|nr:lipid A deacylase LpxR family protein [Candidatus Aminicenantes bacterium]
MITENKKIVIKNIKRFFVLAFIPFFLAGPAAAQKARREKGGFFFNFENDTFYGTDKNYSSGLNFSWVSPEVYHMEEKNSFQGKMDSFIHHLALIRREGFKSALHISLAQKIFTPEDIKETDLIENDRPYAGITYMVFGIQSRDSFRMDTLNIQIGILGPHSYAENMQSFIHKILGDKLPQGWDNQLKDELIINISYGTKRKWISEGHIQGFSGELIPHLRGTMGNGYTGLDAGAELRIGWNIPDDFGTYLIKRGGGIPAVPNTPRLRNQRYGFGLYVFAAVFGQAVMRDIFLDGNTFRKSHHVEREKFYGTGALGVGVTLGRVKVGYSAVWQSKRFVYQTKPHVYGAIHFSIML